MSFRIPLGPVCGRSQELRCTLFACVPHRIFEVVFCIFEQVLEVEHAPTFDEDGLARARYFQHLLLVPAEACLLDWGDLLRPHVYRALQQVVLRAVYVRSDREVAVHLHKLAQPAARLRRRPDMVVF